MQLFQLQFDAHKSPYLPLQTHRGQVCVCVWGGGVLDRWQRSQLPILNMDVNVKSKLVGVILQQTHHIGKSSAAVLPAVIGCVSGVEREHWLYGLKNSMVCLSEGTTLTYFRMIRAHSKHQATSKHMHKVFL